MPILDTPCLILREFRFDDVDAMIGVFGDAEVMKYGDGVQTREWIHAWIARWIGELYAAWGFGMWAVVEKRSGGVIGYGGLSQFAERCAAHEAEIGFRLRRACWGRGFGTEAALAVRDYGFGTLRLTKLVAIIDPGNAAAVRVAEKVGLRYEREVSLPGYDHPDHVYALNRPSDDDRAGY